MTANQSIRVLHVVHSLERGGIQTWLLHVLREMDRDRFRLDFVTPVASPKGYDEAVRTLGARLHYCPSPARFWAFGKYLTALMQKEGPYDVVHSHFCPSGFPLIWAHKARVPMRIVHSHNAAPELIDFPPLVAKGLRPISNGWIRKHATLALAASREAAEAVFGTIENINRDRRILYYGVDLTPFGTEIDRTAVRRELQLPADALVIGHVGRFMVQKNHDFLLDIAAELARQEPRFHLLLIGDGPLRDEMGRKVTRLGLERRVTFLGLRSDVPRLMRGAMDGFLLPSHYEGLPLVGIEAQAAGLVCFWSDAVTPELDVVKPLLGRLPLTAPPALWAERMLSHLRIRHSLPPANAAYKIMVDSPFNIRNSAKALEHVYESARHSNSGARS